MSSSRERAASGRFIAERKLVTASSGGAANATAGSLASSTWLRTRGIGSPSIKRWHVEIALDVLTDRAPTDYDETSATRFHLNIYTEEWGVYFCHAALSSWIRVTDIPFVHGRDDYRLLGIVPALKDIGQLLRQIERAHGIQFQRRHATVQTNIPGAEQAIRDWICSL